tara:strand:- start:86 stop:772 length:687 start_codon:yes stop_codon:yes gene_type:complete
MFSFIFKTIILLYFIFIIYFIINNQKYNINGIVVDIKNEKEFIDKLPTLNPLKFKHINNYKPKHLPNNYLYNENNININYLYNSSNDLVFIEKDKNIFMYDDNKYVNTLIDQNKSFTPLDYSTSIYKKNIIIPLNRCIHNYNIIGIIDGETTIYLFNPKHKDDIINKKNNEIKKWGHKLKLQKDDTILIPTNWYYIQETKDKCIQYHIEIDDIFTYLPTLIKSKISYK